MAVAVASTSTASGAGSATLTKPTGTANGDLLLLIIADGQGTSAQPSLPATFTSLDTAQQGAAGNCLGVLVCWKIASSEGASYSLSSTGGTLIAVMYRITGAHPTLPLDAHVLSHNTSTTGPTVSAVTPSVANSLVILTVAADGAAATGSAATTSAYALTNNSPTFTEVADFSVNSGSDYVDIASAWGTYTATTTTGAASATLSAARQYGMSIVAIIPPGADVSFSATTQSMSMAAKEVFTTVLATTVSITMSLLSQVQSKWTLDKGKNTSSWTDTTKT